jgi:hypothetical protein
MLSSCALATDHKGSVTGERAGRTVDSYNYYEGTVLLRPARETIVLSHTLRACLMILVMY